MRGAVVSGSFYEKDKESLKRQIESCFKYKFGAGINSLKSKNKKNIQRIFSIIVPHAGYAFSGYCASHAYAELVKLDPKKDTTFIILGPNHTRQSNADFSVSLEDFQTPLGPVINHSEFSQELINQEKLVKHDESAHEQEHSIEVQLPFLQYIFKKFMIIPIVCSTQDYKKLDTFAKSLSELIKKQEKKNPNLQFVIIASSDFTHYGPNYDFVPFPLNQETKKNLYKFDKQVIDQITQLNSKAFFTQAKKSTICGLSTITIAIETSKLLGAKTCQLLKYYSSGDIIQDYENSVGYASLVIQ